MELRHYAPTIVMFIILQPLSKMKVLMKDNTFFMKSFDYQESINPFMGDFFPAHFYLCHSFIEVETHSPTKVLKPGNIISWQEI